MHINVGANELRTAHTIRQFVEVGQDAFFLPILCPTRIVFYEAASYTSMTDRTKSKTPSSSVIILQ